MNFTLAPGRKLTQVDYDCPAFIDAQPKKLADSLKRSQTAFTLIEVLLAISITLGMFVIVLFFYQQASNTRNAVLTEVGKVTAARMIMGQITSELRSAISAPDDGIGLKGSSTSIKIATLGLPPAVLNLSASNNPSTIFQTGVKLVSYSSLGAPEMPEELGGTNAFQEEAPSPFADL
ncbi:MAG: PulJ/GspJ family protein, partial [Verrucomicrobiales bacterium]